jgi:hypothetical protein
VFVQSSSRVSEYFFTFIDLYNSKLLMLDHISSMSKSFIGDRSSLMSDLKGAETFRFETRLTLYEAPLSIHLISSFDVFIHVLRYFQSAL